jgi:hypothetical protein
MNGKIINIQSTINWGEKIAWTILILSLLGFLTYGLSLFFAASKIETVTTNPTNTNASGNSYLNQTQDVNFQNHQSKKHTK